jgi:hypothetical protein
MSVNLAHGRALDWFLQKQAACGDNLCWQHAVWPVQRCWRVPRHYRCQHPARRKQDSATSKVTLTSSGTGLKWRAQLKHRTLASGRGAAPPTLQCSPGSTSSTSCPWCVVSCLACVSQEAHAGTCHTSDATSTRRNNARVCFASLSEATHCTRAWRGSAWMCRGVSAHIVLLGMHDPGCFSDSFRRRWVGPVGPRVREWVHVRPQRVQHM